MLEADLKDEYEAVDNYEQHISRIEDLTIKRKLTEIRDEELHHIEELKALLHSNLDNLVRRLK